MVTPRYLKKLARGNVADPILTGSGCRRECARVAKATTSVLTKLIESQNFPKTLLRCVRHLDRRTDEAQSTARSSAYAIIQMAAKRVTRGICEGNDGEGSSSK
jgi:hypothetical protein